MAEALLEKRSEWNVKQSKEKRVHTKLSWPLAELKSTRNRKHVQTLLDKEGLLISVYNSQ